MTDPALLHAVLFNAALSLAILQGRSVTPELMYHKSESIRLLNKRLRNPHDTVATDSTLAAVVYITNFEVSSEITFFFFKLD
jgi:hypothetical protein